MTNKIKGKSDMFIDYHSHILPQMDDGSRSVEESVEMINTLQEQGVERFVATPHFYAHKEESVSSFLKKRENSFNKLSGKNLPLEKIHLGAEVYIESGISEYQDIEKLAISGTSLILLEPPYSGYIKNLSDEVENIAYSFKLKPVIAHLHRYIGLYKKSEIEEILNLDAIFQINNEAFTNLAERNFVKNLIKNDYPVIFGSDCHNMMLRFPNFDIIAKKSKKIQNIIDKSNTVFEKYKI